MNFKTYISIIFTLQMEIHSILETDWKSVDIKSKIEKARYDYPENVLRMIPSTKPHLCKQFYDGNVQILSYEKYLAVGHDEHRLIDVHAVDSEHKINMFLEIQTETMEVRHLHQVKKSSAYQNPNELS